MSVELCEHVIWDMANERWLEIACKIKDDHGIMHKINNIYWVFCGVCKKLWGTEPKCGHCKTIVMCPHMKEPAKIEMPTDEEMMQELSKLRTRYNNATLYLVKSQKSDNNNATNLDQFPSHLDMDFRDRRMIVPIKQEKKEEGMPNLV